MYLQYYLMGIILLPAIILAIYAQTKVQTTYSKYSNYPSKGGYTARDISRVILDTAGLEKIDIGEISGNLSDHFDPRNNVVNLSSGVANSTSVAAIGVACHEVGHAIQHARHYVPAKLRQLVIPLCNFSSIVLWPLIVIGLIFNFAVFPGTIYGDILLWCGIGFFGIMVIFNLLTLSSEFDASRRALKILKEGNFLDSEELVAAKEVLSAAALTYVAALLTSILELVRFLMVVLGSNRRN